MNQPEPLHRIKAVAQSEGVSLRSAARRLDQTMQDTREQMNPQTDLLITQVRSWAEALGVPVAELLEESAGVTGDPVLKKRAKLLRLAKLATTLQSHGESTKDRTVELLALQINSILIELMPELEAGVTALQTVGQRRTQDELGAVADHVVDTHGLLDENER